MKLALKQIGAMLVSVIVAGCGAQRTYVPPAMPQYQSTDDADQQKLRDDISQAQESLDRLNQLADTDIDEFEKAVLMPLRQWQASAQRNCNSPNLAKAVKAALDATNSPSRFLVGEKSTFAAAQLLLEVGDAAKNAHCKVTARGMYDAVVATYIGADYAAFRERARIGIDDLRSP